MRNLRFEGSLLVLMLAFCGAAHAQLTRGYAYVAPGGITQSGNTTRAYAVGGGVERLLDRGIGVGAELEGVVPGTGRSSEAVGILSINPYYHFLRERKLDPYATAGYSLVFRDFTGNAFNYGAGLNYWFQDNLGVLAEVRDHRFGRSGGPAAHYWGVRIGLTFR
jgi:hypothetical protein